MTNNAGRTYVKGEPIIEPKEDIRHSKKNTLDKSNTVVQDPANAAYSKGKPTIMPRHFVVIVSGGEAREKNYFKILSRTTDFPQIKVEFNVDSNQLNPERMLDFAKEIQVRYKSSETDEPDTYYLISDVDHFMDELIHIKPKCEKYGLNLIVSNPCFEVWLYYSKRQDKLANFLIPQDILKISSAIKTWLPTEIKGGVNPVKAIFDIKKNIKNAELNYAEDTNQIPERFSTNMYVMANRILPYIIDDLNRIKELNRKKEQKFRNKI